MAVYEIARIQLRRGRINNSVGIPQLASGELAWAIDSQELFIGNGAIAEGAPIVGNTRILTEKDLNQWGFLGGDSITIETMPWQTGADYTKGAIVSNNIDENGQTYNYTFLCIQSHTSGDFITDLNSGNWIRTPYVYSFQKEYVDTGPTPQEPVIRAIRDRLSDRVSLFDFVTINDQTSDDYTDALSRAINNLYSNSLALAKDEPTYRITLEIPAGIYNISSTISIPSFASIIGAGIDKTIINYTGTGPVFTFSADSNPINYNSQPRHILLQGMSIITADITQETVRLDSVRNSVFKDIKISNQWGLLYTQANHGILLTAIASNVTCEYNLFDNIYIENISNGIWSSHDIRNNTFSRISIANSGKGIVFGYDTDTISPGQEYGPKSNTINNCTFTGIFKQAVHIATGSENSVLDCTLTNVGNDSIGSLETTPIYPQVYFNQPNNSYQKNRSSRTEWLSAYQTQEVFIPELSGTAVKFGKFGNDQIDLATTVDWVLLFRLPLRTDESGVAEKIAGYSISYNYDSETISGYIRSGILDITVDFSNLLTPVQLIDTFDYAGIPSQSATNLRFNVRLINKFGEIFNGSGTLAGLGVFYRNTLESDQGDFTYTYQGKF